VIGGGLAGLASAVALAEAGVRVRLLEKRPHLGGRATSYALPDGSEVDNCQHVTLSCCTNLADFYRRVGAQDKVRFYDKLYFADRAGRRSTIEASLLLPPPLHMAASFLFFKGLSLADKSSIAKALLAIARAGGNAPAAESISMLEWLRRMDQTPGAIEHFWRVVLVSALDEELDRMGARYGIDVFWKGFLANRSGYRLGIPAVPLADLYEGCRDSVARSGEVRLRTGVRNICVHEGRFAGVTLDDGAETSADACISAVPQDAVLGIAPRELAEPGGPLAGIRNIRTAPITGVHLWFDRAVMSEPFLALLEHTTQWIFNKTLLYAMPGGTASANAGWGRGQYLQLVISASHGLVQRSRQDIIELCRRELADILPATREATLEKATVIKEVNATFSPEPGVDCWRPAQASPVKNLFFAGDWTRTGWPATMEGAVRSGYLAAEAVLAEFGRPKALLQPDLPVEGLSKMWVNRRHPRAEAAGGAL